MKNMYKLFVAALRTLFFIVAIASITAVSFYMTLYYVKQKTKNVVTTILQQTNESGKYIVIEQVHNFDVKVKENEQGIINKLLFKHVVEFRGKAKAYIGYDLRQAKPYITYDFINSCYQLSMPTPKVLAIEIMYPIEFSTQSGAIYKLLKEDIQTDLNDVLMLAKKQVKTAANKWIFYNKDEIFKLFKTQLNKKIQINWCSTD